MRRSGLILVALLVAGALMAAPPTAADKADAGRITQLILQLGSRKFSAREAASKTLDQIGEPALPALRQAAQSTDPEVRTRAQKLVKSIADRVDNAALLAPRHIHLTFKDTPVEQAVAEFAKKSGYDIRLSGDKTNLNSRKVSLDTGETTFWRAFDAFCDKAHVVEAPPEMRFPRSPKHMPRLPALPPPPPPARGGAAAPLPNNGPALVFLLAPPPPVGKPMRAMKIRPGFTPSFWNQIVLIDGEPRQLPTSYYGAVRVRATPVQRQGDMPLANTKTLIVALETTPEPRFPTWRAQNVRIDKALDEKGQMLADASDKQGPGQASNLLGPPSWATTGLIAVALKAGDKPARSLKQLKGSVSVLMRTEDATLLVVDEVLQAENKTVETVASGSLKILQAKRHKDGTFTLKVDTQRPLNVFPGMPPRPATVAPAPPTTSDPARGAPPVKGRGLLQAQPMTSYNGLAALDAKGEPVPISHVEVKASVGLPNQWTQQVTLTLKPGKGQGAPAKLTFTGFRMVTVRVPFDLADVPVS